MAKNSPVLFKIVIGSKMEVVDPDVLYSIANATKACARELLAVVGYAGRIRTTVHESVDDRLLAIHVSAELIAQLNLFEARPRQLATPEVSELVLQAAVTAIARFRRAINGVTAASMQELLKSLKAADPSVIGAISRMANKQITVSHEGGELELSVQTESSRSLSNDVLVMAGTMVAVGFEEMSFLPFDKRSPRQPCIHPVRVRVPRDLRDKFEPVQVLAEFVRTRRRIELSLRAEDVTRMRQHRTYELTVWPPALQ